MFEDLRGSTNLEKMCQELVMLLKEEQLGELVRRARSKIPSCLQ